MDLQSLHLRYCHGFVRYIAVPFRFLRPLLPYDLIHGHFSVYSYLFFLHFLLKQVVDAFMYDVYLFSKQHENLDQSKQP